MTGTCEFNHEHGQFGYDYEFEFKQENHASELSEKEHLRLTIL